MSICVRKSRCLLFVVTLSASLTQDAGGRPASSTRFADQGLQWDADVRAKYYSLDQGSRMMPLAWLQALKRQDGGSFLGDGLARYGYLPNPGQENHDHLPVGFSVAPSPQGPSVGLPGAACHTREIDVDGQTWRIDGGPGFVDFQSFLADLDTATLRVLATDEAFHAFARAVVGSDGDSTAIATLRTAVELWSKRFHTLKQPRYTRALREATCAVHSTLAHGSRADRLTAAVAHKLRYAGIEGCMRPFLIFGEVATRDAKVSAESS